MASVRRREAGARLLADLFGEPSEGGDDGAGGVNPWTGRPYTPKYYEILSKRKGLPVWQQQKEFTETLAKNQTLILVGETGSGKTTTLYTSLKHLANEDVNV